MTPQNKGNTPAINPSVDPPFESKVEARTPEWVKDAIFYQIFPDRFATFQAVTIIRHLQTLA